MNKEKCDHIIGVHSYAWSLKTQSKNKLHPEDELNKIYNKT